MLPDLLTTREAADYLRIKERKLYEMVHDGVLPCSRVGGKWVFPRRLLELWVLRNADGLDGLDFGTERPPVVAGSHDPLLEWAVRESGCDLALLFDGSMAGLARLADGKALACGLHVPEDVQPESAGGGAETGGVPGAMPVHEWNIGAARRALAGVAFVLIEWAWRDQGLLLPAGNPRGVRGVADLGGLRMVDRQEGAGSRLLFARLAAAADLSEDALLRTGPPARSETDVALAVANGSADAGFGIGALARSFGLDFVPLARERYDLAVPHRDYFDPPWQALMAFTGTDRFAGQAAQFGGYDVSGVGTVRYNAGSPTTGRR